ncbi:hypothetical protein J4V89_18015 [Escherichia coli]
MAKEKLVTIHVHTPFTLTLGDQSKQEFGRGRHNVPEEVASHWFTQAHSELSESVITAPRCRTMILRWLVGRSPTRTRTEISRSAAPQHNLPASQRMAFILCAGLCTLAIQGARRGTWI